MLVQGVLNDLPKLGDLLDSGIESNEDRVSEILVVPTSGYGFLVLGGREIAQAVDLIFHCDSEGFGVLDDVAV